MTTTPHVLAKACARPTGRTVLRYVAAKTSHVEAGCCEKAMKASTRNKRCLVTGFAYVQSQTVQGCMALDAMHCLTHPLLQVP